MNNPRYSAASLRRLLRPRSVAIVGASPEPGSLGASVLANLDRAGYRGDVFLVNPKRDKIGQRPCLKSAEELPRGVDVAVLAIPRAAVLPSVEALAERDVGAFIIFSSGFAEAGEAGLLEQRQITRLAHAKGFLVEGPNCLGMVNYIDGIPLTFVAYTPRKLTSQPGIGLVSQSGAMAAVVSATLMSRELDMSYAISTGNEAASGVEDFVEYLVEEPNTKVIGLIVEQFRMPRRFLGAARRAREVGKQIILLHPGRSGAARASAATHTGALAGDYQVMRARVERAGVVLVESLEEFGDVLDIATRAPRVSRQGTAVLTDSGAFKALTLDLGETIGLNLPAISDADSPQLRAAIPDLIPVSNPLDLTAQSLIDPDLYRRALTALADDQRFGSIVLCIVQTDKATADVKFPPILAAIQSLKSTKPILFAGLDEGATVPSEYVSALRALGVPYFPTPERAVRALAHLSHLAARNFSRAEPIPLDVKGIPNSGGILCEYQVKRVLESLGIPVPRGRFVTTFEEALKAAAAIGFPVALKAQSPDLCHKSDAGGVILGLRDAKTLAAGWHQLRANLAKLCPDLNVDGVLIESMAKPGVELILGARKDPDWGPIVLVGFGGVAAEILHDVCLLPPDLTTEAIVGELLRLKQSPLLRGFRGSPALDVWAFAEIAAKLGRLLVSEPSVREIDLNPVVVYPVGEGVVVLDALLLADPQ